MSLTSIAFNSVFLLFALGVIIKSSGMLVSACVRLSRRYNISEFVVGLVVIALGTSLPELFTGIASSLFGHAEVSIGNIMGANMLNITLILGAAIFFLHGYHHSRAWLLQGIVLVAATLVFVAFLVSGVTRFEGIILLLLFALYLGALLRFSREHIKSSIPSVDLARQSRYDWLIIPVAIAGLGLSSTLIVASVLSLSSQLNVSSAIISALIVSVGTTLPELMVTIQAVHHESVGVLIGNLIGSNISNMLLITGVVAVLHPIAPPGLSVYSMLPFFVLAPLLALLYLSRRLPSSFGIGLVLFYLLFVFTTIFYSIGSHVASFAVT